MVEAHLCTIQKLLQNTAFLNQIITFSNYYLRNYVKMFTTYLHCSSYVNVNTLNSSWKLACLFFLSFVWWNNQSWFMTSHRLYRGLIFHVSSAPSLNDNMLSEWDSESGTTSKKMCLLLSNVCPAEVQN